LRELILEGEYLAWKVTVRAGRGVRKAGHIEEPST